ncbi:hypothetical protein NP233_g8321 [Leucocoprinus birnbaumii]|uniref:Plus3 domain-containing protein n=1 Tax=Leucocoprinus birnbaumii TaxID=56174 RepID=A0AAD5YTV2_9AGAR|nr:hypothetical protein NP233_g8321 [Leucocoprinus birnbaumii]
MSDLDDELLALAGAGDKKRKKSHSSKSNKRRKEDEDEQESVESEMEDEDPYPLEGKYKDEEDRQQLLQMSEIEREDILAQRLEEKQQLLDKRLLSQMVQQQRGGGGEESVAKAAKRQHTARGATKEKTSKLAELKAKRKAKDERKRNSSPKRDRSSSPMDMEISDGESEDGQITKFEQEEEKVGRIFNKPPSVESEPITMEDLEKCRITRDYLVKHSLAPWFEDYVKGAWVRYLIGNDQENRPELTGSKDPAADFVKPYKIDDKVMNQALELKLSKSVRVYPMDKVSNGKFTLQEFNFWKATLATDDMKLPTKRDIEHKVAQMNKLSTQPVTESDINAMLARKSQLQSGKPSGMVTVERSRLNAARTLALRRNDIDEVAQIDAQLAALGVPAKPRHSEEAADLLAKVNERNRKANMEAVRKAEIAEAERKRRERKLAAAGTPVPIHDPSARLKTVPRLFNSATPTTSRPGTPGGTPQPSQSVSASPLPPSALSGKTNGGAKTFEASVLVLAYLLSIVESDKGFWYTIQYTGVLFLFIESSTLWNLQWKRSFHIFLNHKTLAAVEFRDFRISQQASPPPRERPFVRQWYGLLPLPSPPTSSDKNLPPPRSAASLTVYVFDYLLTFEQELSLIWNSRWTWMKFLFLLDRYMMVPNFIMQTFLVGTVKYRGNIDCQHLALAWNYLCTIELFLSEIILSLRLWAMWGNNKWIFLGVMSIFVGTAVWQQYDAEIAFKTGDYSFDPLLSNLSKGCVFDARVNHAGIAYLVTLTVDFIMVMLALAPTVRLSFQHLPTCAAISGYPSHNLNANDLTHAAAIQERFRATNNLSVQINIKRDDSTMTKATL